MRLQSILIFSLTFPAIAQEQPAPAADAAQQTAADVPGSSDLMRHNGGSLLRASLATQEAPPPGKGPQISFLDVPAPEPRTLKKHDLVTIIVREESNFSSDGTSDVKRESSIDAKLEQFIKLSLSNWELQNSIGDVTPAIKGSTNREMKNEATVDRSDRFITRITAEVVDVKPNGNLMLQARSRMKQDDEEHLLVLSGTCRAEDVTGDNTVLSTQLYDKDLSKTSKGIVRDGTKRGWVVRLLDALNPF